MIFYMAHDRQQQRRYQRYLRGELQRAATYTAFALGAVIPLGPYLIGPDRLAFVFSAALSAGALLLIGGILGLVTGRNFVRGGLRMLLVAGAATTVTYGVGRLVGGALLA